MKRDHSTEGTNPSSPGITRRDILRMLGFGLLVAPAAAVAGCTTSRENHQYVVKIQVEQSQSHYSPADLVIPKGTTVTWQNIATYPQTVTCDPSKASKDYQDALLPKGAQPFDSGELYPGQTWSYTFNVPGSYVYFSRYTPVPSIVGTIQVSA